MLDANGIKWWGQTERHTQTHRDRQRYVETHIHKYTDIDADTHTHTHRHTQNIVQWVFIVRFIIV